MSPILPVRQNAQAMAQPTCVEMQKVMAGVSGMNTDSMALWSPRRSRNFSVPSVERSRAAMDGVVSVKSDASVARRSRGRSVIAARSVTPRR